MNCIVFAPRKYLTLIFLFMDIYSSISPNIVEFSEVSLVSFLQIIIVLLYSVAVCVIDIFCWSRLDFLYCGNLFIRMFHDFLYFIYRIVLSFWTAERFLFGRFITYNVKICFRWLTLKTLNGFIISGCIKFPNYWRGIFL